MGSRIPAISRRARHSTTSERSRNTRASRHPAPASRRGRPRDREIAALIGRPALLGRIGEFLASRVFDIELHPSAAHPGSDGVFRSGPLIGKTVNVKCYTRLDGLLDVPVTHAPDYLLVLVGPKAGALASPETAPVLLVDRAFVFEYERLVGAGVKPGIAASGRRALWDDAEVYPSARTGACFRLEADRRTLLALFG